MCINKKQNHSPSTLMLEAAAALQNEGIQGQTHPVRFHVTQHRTDSRWDVTSEVRVERTVCSPCLGLCVSLGSSILGEPSPHFLKTARRRVSSSGCEEMVSMSNSQEGAKPWSYSSACLNLQADPAPLHTLLGSLPSHKHLSCNCSRATEESLRVSKLWNPEAMLIVSSWWV